VSTAAPDAPTLSEEDGAGGTIETSWRKVTSLGECCRVVVCGPSRLVLEAIAAALDHLEGFEVTYAQQPVDPDHPVDAVIVELQPDGRLPEGVQALLPVVVGLVIGPNRTSVEPGVAVYDPAGGIDGLAKVLRSRASDGWDPVRPAVNTFGRKARLSPRETEVVGLLAQGAAQDAIAAALSLSSQTVRTHIQNAMAKLGAHSRQEAIDQARAQGLLGAADAGDEQVR
jgi:DNA-binding CsgD family transcriptional regulator